MEPHTIPPFYKQFISDVHILFISRQLHSRFNDRILITKKCFCYSQNRSIGSSVKLFCFVIITMNVWKAISPIDFQRFICLVKLLTDVMNYFPWWHEQAGNLRNRKVAYYWHLIITNSLMWQKFSLINVIIKILLRKADFWNEC